MQTKHPAPWNARFSTVPEPSFAFKPWLTATLSRSSQCVVKVARSTEAVVPKCRLRPILHTLNAPIFSIPNDFHGFFMIHSSGSHGICWVIVLKKLYLDRKTRKLPVCCIKCLLTRHWWWWVPLPAPGDPSTTIYFPCHISEIAYTIYHDLSTTGTKGINPTAYCNVETLWDLTNPFKEHVFSSATCFFKQHETTSAQKHERFITYSSPAHRNTYPSGRSIEGKLRSLPRNLN